MKKKIVKEADITITSKKEEQIVIEFMYFIEECTVKKSNYTGEIEFYNRIREEYLNLDANRKPQLKINRNKIIKEVINRVKPVITEYSYEAYFDHQFNEYIDEKTYKLYTYSIKTPKGNVISVTYDSIFEDITTQTYEYTIRLNKKLLATMPVEEAIEIFAEVGINAESDNSKYAINLEHIEDVLKKLKI